MSLARSNSTQSSTAGATCSAIREGLADDGLRGCLRSTRTRQVPRTRTLWGDGAVPRSDWPPLSVQGLSPCHSAKSFSNWRLAHSLHLSVREPCSCCLAGDHRGGFSRDRCRGDASFYVKDDELRLLRERERVRRASSKSLSARCVCVCVCVCLCACRSASSRSLSASCSFICKPRMSSSLTWMTL